MSDLFPIYFLFFLAAWIWLVGFRHSRWFFILWLPLLVISIVGTVASFAAIFMAASLGDVPGPGAPLEGIAVLLSLVLTLPFIVLLGFCLWRHPTKEALKLSVVLPTTLGYVFIFLAVLFFEIRAVKCVVVDDSKNPVQGVELNYERFQKVQAVTDGNGTAKIYLLRWKTLNLGVAKKNYYVYQSRNKFSFGPAEIREILRDKRPIIFHLRKKGEGADLITSQHAIRSDFPVHIPRDGTPVEIDFLKRNAGDSGQMQITENKPEFKNWKQATNWWFRLEIPDGGFVGENDEFPFTAPEAGYTNVLEFNFQKNQPDWTTDINTNYYIRFGNPPLYGRLHVQTGISYGGAILQYAINPDGSRNLEPK